MKTAPKSSSSTAKIGSLVAQVRQQRGLTQAEFAQQLGTSQSAVNRIEKGHQNVSIDMLGRISEVLNKQIISVSSGSNSFQIEGGHELSGSITTKTSKNAAVALLCAALLNKGTTTLKNVARIEEVNRIIEALTSMGVSIKWTGNDIEIKRPARIKIDKLDGKAARKTRSVLMFLGPLMHESKEFKIPYAGGCKLGARTVQPHLFALENFGVDVVAKSRNYHVTVNRKRPEPIIMYEMTDTGTENALMAAARTSGVTEIKFASHNYMVRDLCYFLEKLGVKIEGIGTNTLKVHGVREIRKNVTYYPAEDPIESMAFISMAAATNSELTIKRSPIDFLELELLKLKKMGLPYTVGKRYKAENGISELADITIHKHDHNLKALDDKLLALPYPGINMDNLPFFVPIAAIAKGTTLVHDWSYENRAIYFTELNKLGADITMADPHRVIIDGPTKFSAADVVCPPALRPAVIIMIAMMAAKGTSVLRNVYSISRGYEDLAERLNAIGAKITVLRDF